MSDPRVRMAARNNVDWYAMMWDVRGLRYHRDAFGFRAIDPPPPYHGWVTLASLDAPIPNIVAPLAGMAGFGVKDAYAAHDLSGFGLTKLFEAQWIWHDPDATGDTTGWSQVTTQAELAVWEDAWRVTSPTGQRQFPNAMLARNDMRIWGRKADDGYDAGFIANLSSDCVGLSNCFGTQMRAAATTLAAAFGAGLPLVGYEREEDLEAARSAGWDAIGPLAVWHQKAER